ncbi:sacsin-like [Crassostrea virginica]
MASFEEGNGGSLEDVDKNQEDSDSDYEGISKPPILRQLKNILAQYPDGSQIIRELVQNAEDAGARTFKIFYKEGYCEPNPGSSDSRYAKYFRTPALCVHNDGVFTEQDWKGIKSIYTSVKEKDALKVGRFGLGFKSIFHITDSPIIISGDKLLIINPLEKAHRVCHNIPFWKLKTAKYKKAWPLLKQTLGLDGEGLFELNESAIDNHHYPKTLFWFPIRQKESELSHKLYTTDQMRELFESFEEEAETILLFLKSVNLISIYDTQFQKKFEVQMKGIANEDITDKREHIKNKVTSTAIPMDSIWSQYKAVLIAWKPEEPQTVQEWLIVNYFQGESDMSKMMSTLAHDEELGYAPYVGVAFPLNGVEGKTFKGHVFCFLPLPIEPDGKSLTNLPVHVNGFFALDSNRRHMLWATRDQHEADDNRLVWNKLVISELLSVAYVRLVQFLLDDSAISSEVVYLSLPDAKNIDDKWSILLQPVYTEIFRLNLFQTENRRQLSLHDALFFMFDDKKKITLEIQDTLWHVLTKYSENVIRLPHHLQLALNRKDLLPKGTKPQNINAELICRFLKEDSRYQLFTSTQKLHILQYLWDNAAVHTFNDLYLLPTNDPKTCSSLNSTDKPIYICLNGEERMFPQIQNKLVSFIPEDLKPYLAKLAESGVYGIRSFCSSDFAPLLKESIDKQNIEKGVEKDQRSFDLTWISEVWRYISDHEELIESVQHLCILPETEKDNNSRIVRLHKLEGLYLLARQGSNFISEYLCEVLQSFGVTILSTLPGYLPHSSVERYICFPTVSGVCEVLEKALKQTIEKQSLIDSFEKLSIQARKSFAIFLSQAGDFNTHVASFLKKLKMFPVIPEKNNTSPSSLNVVMDMTPHNCTEYPIPFPYPLIDGDFEGAKLVLGLGFCRLENDQLMLDILNKINSQDVYNDKEIDAFMEYFLTKIEHSTDEQRKIASTISFLHSEDGVRRRPGELFELTEDMQMLFYREDDKFPRDLEYAKMHVNKLKMLGLKSSRDISLEDLMQTLNILTKMNDGVHAHQMILKVRAFEKFANQFIGNADMREEKIQLLLKNMRSSCWMTKKVKRPKHYPPNMQWYSEGENVETPFEMFHPDYEMLVGSVRMIAESTLNRHILDELLHKKPTFEEVLDQLLHLSTSYRDCTMHSEFLHNLREIYDFLAGETENNSLLNIDSYKESSILWTGKVFAKPKKVFIENISDATELSLEPFMYKLQAETKVHETLFRRLGCLLKLKAEDLLNILDVIKDCQRSPGILATTSKHNLLVVEGILNILEDLYNHSGLSDAEKERILFPVEIHGNGFELLPAKECTYIDYRRDMDETEEEEDLKYVHYKIRSSVAENLGVPSLTRRIVETKGVEDIPWGQKEELTDRLKNLIEEYADGSSVLKEMLQNADDAGATCLRILYDERRNENAQDRLIDKGMVECQGPAIWVYNDAKFSKDDFENIIKLGAGTKESDLTKIGKFGLGFCSVYNITDMPSILSGESLVILDPRMIHLGKALKNNNPGLRFKISDSKTRHRLKNQIRPFNGVFDCDFENEFTCYEGTLFRLPLRTAKQADETKNLISPRQYTREDVIRLIKKFIEHAGNLVLFLQNVSKIEFLHWPQQASEAHLFYRILRSPKKAEPRDESKNVLRLGNTLLDSPNRNPVQKKESIIVSINLYNVDLIYPMFDRNVTNFSCETEWLIFWQIGTVSSNVPKAIAKKNVIVGGTASPLIKFLQTKGREEESTELPLGFYSTGHVFCFLPLPQESFCPVHVNGYFAVEASRRRLVTNHADNVHSEGAEWNKFLLKTVVCESYLKMLENMPIDSSQINCYDLWPFLGQDDMMNVLVISFYENVVSSSHDLFYRGESQRYSFKECVFLDPALRYEMGPSVGSKAMECFLEYNSYEPQRHAMDLPEDVYKQFQKIPMCIPLYNEHLCDQKTFFLSIFIPSVSKNFWDKWTKERNKLIMKALEIENEELRRKIKETPCIPTKPHGKLRKPSDLMYPDVFTTGFCISHLFSEEDERFPSEDFSTTNVVKHLKELGMMIDTLSDELVIDRVKSIPRLSTRSDKMEIRCKLLLQYLEQKLDCHVHIQNAVQNIKFLPVLQKPSNWPFTWFSGESRRFESGKKLCLKHCKNIVGCVRPIANLDYKVPHRVVKYLGFQDTRDIEEKDVINQFEEMTKISIDHLSEQVWNIFDEVYGFLDRATSSNLSFFKDKRCILVKSGGLVKPSSCALELNRDFAPFLFKIDERWIPYGRFLKNIGVEENFSVQYLVQTMKTMNLKESEKSNHIHTIVNLLNMLSCSSRRVEFSSSCVLEEILLPDHEGFMRKPAELCIDDGRKIAENDNILFVNKELNTWTTSLFNIKSKSAQFIKRFAGAMSFGQSEALVTRLKGILEDCPYTVSILNELIQNADDAGATEIHFVHDQRSHPVGSLFDKSLEETQGPSLVVFNNSCFSKNDIDGISRLGEGSKRSDPMATGQFGIGFNAVYRITDVPSFLTIGETVPNGGALVMFDPHCNYVPLATPQSPGMMIKDIKMIERDFPDMYNAYLTNKISGSKGTWFRFPLRTESMAKQSKIRPKCVTNGDLEECFKSLEKDIPKSLIFLANVIKISLSVITDDGTMEQIATVTSDRDPTVQEKLTEFYRNAKKHTESLRSAEIPLGQEKGVSIQYTQKLDITTNEKKCQELWSVSHVCGTFASGDVAPMLIEGFRNKEIALSPRAGVAYQITTYPDIEASTAFNFLPLPIQTKLPVHVNGHFAVDSARINIFEKRKGENIKEIWNDFLIGQAIPFAYMELICYLRDHLFESTEMDIVNKLYVYNNAFPILENVENTRWKMLIEKFYQTALAMKMKIFPIFFHTDVGNTLSETQYFLAGEVKSRIPGGQVSFLTLTNDNHDFSPYFMPFESNCLQNPETEDRWNHTILIESDLANILKSLGLKLLDVSAEVAKSVQKSLDKRDSPPYLQQIHIIDFLRSWNTKAEDKCLLSRVGVQVSETILKDIRTIETILTLCFGSGMDKYLKNLEGIPLCVQSDNKLQVFSKDKKLYVSQFFDLLPNAADKFLHKDFVNFFSEKSKEVESFLLPLNIEIFAELLEHDPTLLRFKNNVPMANCELDTEWFLRFWKFLSTLPQRIVIEETNRHFGSWCFIPAMNKGQLTLYPFKLRYALLETKSFIDEESFTDRKRIGKILSSLYIPSPFMELIGQSYQLRELVKKICASLHSPHGLLECLLLHRNEYNISVDDANALLVFLYHKLHDKMNEVRNKFKGLVLYESYDGTLTSLDSNEDIIAMASNSVPEQGLGSLSKHCKLTIIKANPLLHELYGCFSVRNIDSVIFYQNYFLQNPQCFNHETLMKHIEFINDEKLFQRGGDKISILLRNCPFVKNTVTKRLQKVCEFVTPYLRLSRRMCTEEQLLPLEPFRDDKWKDFLVHAGLKCTISEEMLLQFAKRIEQRETIRADSHSQLASDSKLLIAEILKIPELHTKRRFLHQLRTIEFLIPTKVEKAYTQIVGSFRGNKSLISFENSVYVESKLMVWSTCKILPDIKWSTNLNWKSVAEILLIRQTPDIVDVISHVHKLCYNLDSVVKKDKRHLLLADGCELHSFMEKIYSKLKTLASNENMREMKKGFTETPLFYNKEQNCFLRWDQVVLELRREEEISNYLCRGSEIYGAHFEFFRELGVTNDVYLFHYARVLYQLKSLVKDRTLIGDELLVCRKAMDGLLTSIDKTSPMGSSQDPKYEKLNEFESIYLPTDSNKLEKSTSLTIIDVEKLGERLKNVQCEQIQYVKNAHVSSSHYKKLLKLPKDFQPKCVSQLVKEVVRRVDRCNSSEVIKNLNKLFRKKEFIDGISAILSKTDAISQSQKDKYLEMFSELRFQQVSNLKTILMWQSNNVEIEGTETPQEVFFDKDASLVYLKIDNLFSSNRHVRDLAFSGIVQCTNGRANHHRAEITRLLECEDVEEIKDVLKNLKVSFESKWEPELGSYVPQDLYDYLELSFQDLKPGEIVALEVLNPGLDDVTEYAYIYAKVIKKIDDYMFPMYEIDNGTDNCDEIAYKLYRIVPSDDAGSSRALEVHSDLKGEIYHHRNDIIFEEIKITLIKAWWCYRDDFKRIRIRMLLNWHPDKHPNKPLATEVTQYILEIIRRLKQGEFKEFAEQFSENYYSRHRRNGNNSFRYGGNISTHAQPMNEDDDEWMEGFFYRRRHRRRRRGGTKSTEKPPNPQPQVGQMWFRQSKYNMKAALMDRKNCPASDSEKGLNWICYKCHMAIEACLRSLIFCQDANKDNQKNHDLVSLSYQVSIPKLTDLCREFQSQVCSNPDWMIFPSWNSVPGDRFTSDQVEAACRIAQQIVDLCDEQWNA